MLFLRITVPLGGTRRCYRFFFNRRSKIERHFLPISPQSKTISPRCPRRLRANDKIKKITTTATTTTKQQQQQQQQQQKHTEGWRTRDKFVFRDRRGGREKQKKNRLRAACTHFTLICISFVAAARPTVKRCVHLHVEGCAKRSILLAAAEVYCRTKPGLETQ